MSSNLCKSRAPCRYLEKRHDLANPNTLCFKCFGHSFCSRKFTYLVCDEALSSRHFLRDLRIFANSLKIEASHWPEHLIDLRRDYLGVFVNEHGRESAPCVEVFYDDPFCREWFRDHICRPLPMNVLPRCTSQSREKYRSIGSILKAYYPDEARCWGLSAANDNFKA